VPDLYQGAELWEQSLVDPDNRRPVDFPARAAALDAGHADPVDGTAKLALTAALLDLRRAIPTSSPAAATRRSTPTAPTPTPSAPSSGVSTTSGCSSPPPCARPVRPARRPGCRWPTMAGAVCSTRPAAVDAGAGALRPAARRRLPAGRPVAARHCVLNGETAVRPK
jgi:hypothetical protein